MKLAPLCLALISFSAASQAPSPPAQDSYAATRNPTAEEIAALGPKSLPLGCENLMMPRAFLAASDMTVEALPARDYRDVVQTCQSQRWAFAYQAKPLPAPKPVASGWLDADRRIHADLLAAQGADILVVPLQTQGYGFDLTERSLMTAQLAYALGDKVADPFLVSRALGEGRRRFSKDEVFNLAFRLKAKSIVYGYVGHLDRRHMNLTIRVTTLSSDPAKTPQEHGQKDWRDIPFTHEDAPYLAFQRLLPEIVAHVGVKPAATKALDKTATFPARITATPPQLVAAETNAMPASTALLLLAHLAPSDAERTRERMFERALVTSLLRDADHARRRFTQAFALMQLERRPVALRVLNNDSGPAAQTLRELLNGNLPQAQAGLAAVKSPFEKFLLQTAIQDLSYRYGREQAVQLDAAMQLFAGVADDWMPLAALRVVDDDKWQVPDAQTIKEIADRMLPMSGMDVTSIVQGGAILGRDDIDETNIDVVTGKHLRKAAQQLGKRSCCSAASAQPAPMDLLWLLEGVAESRLVKSLLLIGLTQANPHEAAALFDKYRSFFDGHPALAAVEARNAANIVTKISNDEVPSWQKKLRDQAQLAIDYGQGQSELTLRALTATGIPSPQSMLPLDAFGYDFPRRSYWPLHYYNQGATGLPQERQIATQLAVETLAFSRADATMYSAAYAGSSREEQVLLNEQIEQRFMGAPGRPKTNNAKTNNAPGGGAPDLIEMARAAIKADPSEWNGYYMLGQALIRDRHDYTAAAQAFLSYPGFGDKPSGNHVRLSNEAYEAGSDLYWVGRPDLAKPLYEFAAGLKTGSEATMAAGIRLNLIAGDFPAAAQGLLSKANRYPSDHVYRDYLSLLHAMGYGPQAWLAFTQVASQFDSPQVWVGALVGHRKEGLDAAGLKQWLLQPEIRTARLRSTQFALGYALQWHATDRLPPENIGKLIDAIEGTPTARIDADGISLVLPHKLDASGIEVVRPKPMFGTARLPPGTLVRSAVSYFADGYAQLRRGNPKAALERFTAYAQRYPIDSTITDDHSYVMAYMAAAAAPLGDPIGLEKYLDARNPNVNLFDFDYWLSKAFFHAHRKDLAAAQTALKTAFALRPASVYRPLNVEFQFAEACEWIYKQTGDGRFREMLLDWSRRHQQIQPTHAWAYAVQYEYETDADARQRALAMTLYLDPNSPRVAKAKVADITRAKGWLETNNPFKQGKRDQAQPRSTA